MFRKTATLLFLLAGAQQAAGTGIMKMVRSFDLCTGTINQYADPIGQGGFSFPMYPCPGQSGSVPTGVLSGTCTQNPYAGRAFTYVRQSTPGAVPQDTIGTAASTPPLYSTDTFPIITSADDVQALANAWCTGVNGPTPPAPLESTCFATLGIRGRAARKRNPGSTVSFTFDANTIYAFAGALYSTETQYTLSGTTGPVLTDVLTPGSTATTTNAVQKGADCNGDACVLVVDSVTYTAATFNTSDYVSSAELNAYTVFTGITCQYYPTTITGADGGLPYAGTGKYDAASKLIAGVDQVATRVSPDPAVANPTNALVNDPLQWSTKVTVRYAGKGYLNYLFL